MNIDDYIKQEVKKPFIWGETDCCWTANRWIEIQTGKAPLNDSSPFFYSDKETAERLMADVGLVNLVKIILKYHKKTKKPENGDIGLILVQANKVAVALKISEGWFTRDEGGFIITPNYVHLFKGWKCRD